MNLHLAEISTEVAPGRHAALLVDQAGWHLSEPARRARQHHHRAAARQMPRTEPAGERLAVHARQLALEPRVYLGAVADVVEKLGGVVSGLFNEP